MIEHPFASYRKNLGTISVETGIFQCDSLSSQYFIKALKLLPILSNTQCGYWLDIKSATKVSHLFFVDDIRLYRRMELNFKTSKKQQKFSMIAFGLEKCSTVFIKKGKFHAENKATNITALYK